MKTLPIAGALLALASPALADCAPAGAMQAAGVTITGETWVEAAEGLPAFCSVTGTMAERTGTDGRPYALRFELRLPAEWSGQFMHQFNGGNDGSVSPPVGNVSVQPPGTAALHRGMAVVSSDAGHDGSANPEAGLAGGNVFGLEYEARRMYGYAAVAMLHPAALALTEAYYGAAPDFVYGAGSSNGGRHAMIAAERMPGDFDGILAGYPGFNLPRAAVQHALDVQSFLSAGPTLAESFSTEDMALVSGAISAACDGLDGAEDGMVFNVAGCSAAFDASVLTCEAGQNSECLSAEQVAALEAIHAGPKDADGNQIYAEWAWDPGIASGNWRFWKLESTIPPWGQLPIIGVMGSGSLAQVFTTPPTEVEGNPEALLDFLAGFDVAREAAKIDATSEAFPESAMEMMTPPNADNPTLAELQDAGGKMIVFHGVADPVFSFLDTASWHDRLSANNPDADDFVRLYAIPGMPHGQGGNAADEVDILSALIEWVENDEAPGALAAHVRADNGEAAANAGASRLLCPYPAFASLTGDDASMAESFSCSEG